MRLILVSFTKCFRFARFLLNWDRARGIPGAKNHPGNFHFPLRNTYRLIKNRLASGVGVCVGGGLRPRTPLDIKWNWFYYFIDFFCFKPWFTI